MEKDEKKTIETELQEARERFQYLLAVSPAIIYNTEVSADYACKFVSENLHEIVGYTPQEMTADPKFWPNRLHPEDAPRVLKDVFPLIERGGGTLEYRFQHREGHYLWFQDTFKVIHDEAGRPMEIVGSWADINDRKGAEEALRESQARFRSVVQSAKDAILLGDAGGTIIAWNKGAEAIFGYREEEVLDKPIAFVMPERYRDAHERGLERFRSTGESHFKGRTVELHGLRKDGSEFPLELSLSSWKADEGIFHSGIIRDITERKQAEEAGLAANVELQETRRYLTRLIENSTDAIISTDEEGNVVLFNEGAEALLGYRGKEIIGRRVTILHESEERAKEVMREMRKRGGSVSAFETTLRAKDGSSIPVLVSASILYDEQGQETGTVGFNTDLRERKQAEDALQKAHHELEKRVEERTTELKEARERLQYLLTVTPGIIYTNQASGDFSCTFVSDNLQSIMGYSPWEMLEDPQFWVKRLHPEDAPRVSDEVFPLIQRGAGTVEYRFRHRRGHYVWIQDTFKVIHDAAGQPAEIVGSWADISERKLAEQALGERIKHVEALQTVIGVSPTIIYTNQTSGDFACTFVSDNLDSIMGYAPWEMLEDPQFWVKRLHPEDAQRVLAEVTEMTNQGGGTVEYRFRHRQGHYIWIQDTFKVMEDETGKPGELVGAWADISGRKQAEAELQRLAEQVELRNRFIRETFGRYLTDEVVTSLLDSPTGLQLGGEKRKVTMMMSDLRGFTSLSERLAPERVVAILNRYLATMVTIIKQYQGTIDEFIGDAIFVLFGAPVWQEDDAQRAVACAVAMQLAMAAVNTQNRQDGLPEVEMGIGVHTGPVVVGNIGSAERMKYGVVGSHVNLTSRIQSYTIGGQILISEPTRKEVGSILRVGKQMEIKAKGFEQPIPLSEVRGIGGGHKLSLPEIEDTLVPLPQEIPLRYTVVEGDHYSGEMFTGSFVKLSAKGAEARLENPVPPLSNLNMNLIDSNGEEIPGVIYGKVVEKSSESSTVVSVRFTSMSPEIETFLHSRLGQWTPGNAE
jgi:PAS domain S-box-containing protein